MRRLSVELAGAAGAAQCAECGRSRSPLVRGARHHARAGDSTGWPASPACRTGWSGVGEHDGVLFVNDSKATNPASTAPALAAFPPDRPSASTGSSAAWPRATISTHARRGSAMSPLPIRSARRGRCFARICSSRRCRSSDCETAGDGGAARDCRGRGRAMSCCCRRPARRSTSSAISRRAAMPFATS